VLHQDVNDAVEKIETKVGVGASPAASATTGQVLMRNVSGGTEWASVTNSQIRSTGQPQGNLLSANGTGDSVWVLPPSLVVANITARNALTGAVNGNVCYVQSINEFQVFNGTVWVTMLPRTAIDVSITPPVSGSYTNATANVAMYTGTSADVTLISQSLSNSSGSTTLMSFAVSGATTIAGSDANSVSNIGATGIGRSRIIRVTGLTAGLNTFTIASRASGVGGSIDRPSITVQALL
jgi:hypothetical protein